MDLKNVQGPFFFADTLVRALHLQGQSLSSISEVAFDHVMSYLDHNDADLVTALNVITGDKIQAISHLVFTAQTMPGHRSPRTRGTEKIYMPAQQRPKNTHSLESSLSAACYSSAALERYDLGPGTELMKFSQERHAAHAVTSSATRVSDTKRSGTFLRL